MRRLLLVLMAALTVTGGLAASSGAAPTTSVIVRGTNGSNPQLTAGFACASAPAASSIPTATSGTVTRYSPWQDPRVPSTPVPGLAPMSGSRYLAYSGVAGYGHGPVAAPPVGKAPTAVSAYVAAPSGAQSAVGFVVGWGTAGSDKVVEYVGFTGALAHPGVGWTKVSFTTASPAATGWNWYRLAPNSASPPVNAWSGPVHLTLAQVESGHTSWQWKAGVLVGCGDAAPGYVDALAVSTAAGTTTYDFEGAASSVTALASATTVSYGQPVTFAARATAENGMVPLSVVRCQGFTCQYVGSSVTSSPSGFVTFQVFPEPGWSYGVRFPGDATFNPAQATIGPIAVRPYLTAALSQHRIHVGQRVRVGGVVGPCTGAARHLVVQRQVGHHWRRVGQALARACAVNGTNQYATLHGAVAIRSLGRWKLRLLVPSVRGYAPTYSRVLRLTATSAPVQHVPTVHYAPAPTTSAPGPGTTAPAPPPPL